VVLRPIRYHIVFTHESDPAVKAYINRLFKRCDFEFVDFSILQCSVFSHNFGVVSNESEPQKFTFAAIGFWPVLCKFLQFLLLPKSIKSNGWSVSFSKS